MRTARKFASSFTFKPDKPDGEINITFVFDASGLKTATEIVVFETLYRDGSRDRRPCGSEGRRADSENHAAHTGQSTDGR